MKFGPKETKQLNEYLRTGRNRNREFLTGWWWYNFWDI